MEEEDKDLNGETQPEESFEDLLEQTLVAPVRLNPGDKVEAEVIKILSEWVFIDLGAKSEGCIALDEFKEIIEGKHDDLPEAAFLFIGTIEEAQEKAEKMMAAS